MKIKDAVKLQEDAHKRKMTIRFKKCNDYAVEFDCLSNFKVMADVCKVLEKNGYKVDVTKAWGVAMWHMLHKYIRILNLYNSGKKAVNESVVDSHDDIENYSELAKECYMDD